MTGVGDSVDLSDRLARLTAVMARRGWDAVVASLPESVFYLSGAFIHTQQLMRRRQCAVVVTADGVATLIVAEIELPLAQRMAGPMPIVTYKELTESACSTAARILNDQARRPAIVAIERSYLPVLDHEVLAAALPASRLTGGDDELMALRRRKSAGERAEMRRAAQVIDRAIAQATEDAGVGMREDALAGMICENIQRLGGGGVRLAAGMVASGENLLVPHHHAGERRLAVGDAVKVAGRATFNGYYGQLARMAVIGRGTPEFLDRYARSREAHRQLLASIRPDVPAEFIHEQALAVRHMLGLNGRLAHVGHGMGLEYMENPKLAPGVADPVEPEMVMQVTTVTNDPYAGLIQIVDMVVIEQNGARLLSDVVDTTTPLCGTRTSAGGMIAAG